MKRLSVYGIVMAVIIFLDQLTKVLIQQKFSLGESFPIINGIFNFTYVRNPGAAFGFMANAHEAIRKPLFLFIPIVACIWLFYLLWQGKNGPKILASAYTLILAGAIGNLIDRFRLGYVVDFLDFYWGHRHFPAFNIADSAITVAAFLLIIDFFLENKRRKQEGLTKKGPS